MIEYEKDLVHNALGRPYWIYKDDTFYQQRIAGAGPYQQKNLKYIRALVPNARTIIDVGMNIGMNTIEYATWADEVKSFEPVKQTYDMALLNIELAKEQKEFLKAWWPNASLIQRANIETNNCGLGDKPGSFEIQIKRNNAGANHLKRTHTKRGPVGASTKPSVDEIQTVEINTLDSYGYKNVDAIKVDAEGYEYPVVMGAEETIMRDKPVVQLEMIQGQPERFGYTLQMIQDWFLERDFIITLPDGTEVDDEFTYYKKNVERFFIHKSKYEKRTLENLFT